MVGPTGVAVAATAGGAPGGSATPRAAPERTSNCCRTTGRVR